MADPVIRPQFRRSEPEPSPWRITYASDLAGKDPAAIDWIVPGLFPRRFVTMLAGPPGVGKSFLMLMLQVASWSPAGKWFGQPIEQHARSYAIYSEDQEFQLHARFNRVIAEYGVDPLDLDEGAVAWTGEPDDGQAFDPILFRCASGQPGQPTDLWRSIAGPEGVGHCTDFGCGLLILDNASTLLDGEDRRHTYEFCHLLKRYAAERNLAIILLHHPNKAGTSSVSGWVWEKSIRHILVLERPKTYDAHTGEDADKLVLRTHITNLPGPKPTIHMQWREGMLELADAPPSLRQRFPLSTSEKADLDLRVLTALKYELGRGHRVLSDPTKAESLFARLRKSASWQHLAPADLEASIDRLIHRGQVVVDKDASPSTLRPAT
jgi:RecA-family ATPase